LLLLLNLKAPIRRIAWLQDTTILSKKHAELNANRLSNENAVKEREGAKAAYASAQKRFQSESAGLASNEDGEDATLNDQLLGKECCENCVKCENSLGGVIPLNHLQLINLES